MKMIRVQQNSGELFTTLVNPAHVVSVTGDDTGSIFYLPTGETVNSSWSIDAAEEVLRHAMDS